MMEHHRRAQGDVAGITLAGVLLETADRISIWGQQGVMLLSPKFRRIAKHNTDIRGWSRDQRYQNSKMPCLQFESLAADCCASICCPIAQSISSERNPFQCTRF